MKRHALFGLAFMILFPVLAAQLPDLFGNRFTTDNGLSGNEVFCATQDRTGFIWLGTAEGLDRFDGHTFSHFRFAAHDANSLANNDVRTVMEDREGRLWIGTYSGGLCRLDRRRERWTRYRHDPHDPGSLGSDRILALLQDRAGGIWIGAWEGGLLRYDARRERFDRFRHDANDPNSLCSDKVSSIYEDRQGFLWIATGDGLSRFDRRRGAWKTFRQDLSDDNSISCDIVTKVHEDRSGILWIGTFCGLNRFDRNTGRWTRFRETPGRTDGIRNDSVFAITEDEDGLLWLGTGAKGVQTLDPGSLHWRFIPDATGSSFSWVECIMIDRGGVIWIGTGNHGVFHYPRAWSRWSYIGSLPDADEGQSPDRAFSLVEDRRGDLWAGTQRGRLWRYAKREGRWQSFPAGNPKAARREGPAVRALLEDSSGNLWMGMAGGMALVDRERNRLVPFPYRQGNPAAVTASLAEDGKGIIWLGSRDNGLFAFDRAARSWRRYGIRDGLCSEYVTDLLADREGVLWIGSEKGLTALFPGNKAPRCFHHEPLNANSISSEDVISLAQDGRGGIWISTRDGLNRYDRRQERWQSYRTNEGLPTNEFGVISYGRDGKIWAEVNTGLLRLDPITKAHRIFSKPDGMNVDYLTGARFQNRDGFIYLFASSGVIRFDPLTILDNPVPPAVAITSCRVNEAPWPRGAGGSAGDPLELHHRQNSLAFEFAALDFTWPAKNLCAYRLLGHDRDWIRCGDRRFVSYTNLSPGRYEFRVIAANNDGVWNREGASLAFVIVPPFWKRWWFYLLAASVFALASHAVILFVRRHFFLLSFWKRKNYIGRYRILRPIATGGMATVYLARPLLGNYKCVAIKVLREEFTLNPVLRKRFRQEGAIIDQIDHRNIVKFLERGRQDETLYIVMEYLEGRTLAERLAGGGKLPLAEWRAIMTQLADVLAKIHSHGIIHRDLKPANIMLCEEGDGPATVKILDFGLARLQMQTNMTEWGGLLGTLPYMAPEQVSRSCYAAAGDIYALGMIGYEALTGRHPFAGAASHEVMHWILHHAVPEAAAVAPEVPAAVSVLLARLIDKEPGRRPDAAALQEALRALN